MRYKHFVHGTIFNPGYQLIGKKMEAGMNKINMLTLNGK